MSWSIRITCLYLGFVALIVSMVFISSNNKEELVSKDYYAQELAYQDKLDAMKNEQALDKSIERSITERAVLLSLPLDMRSKNIEGEIYFYCPASSANDKKIKMHFNAEGKQEILKSSLKSGVYKMQLSWKEGNKKYFREEIINI